MNADLNRLGAPGAFLNRLVLGFHFGLVFWTIVPDLILGFGAAIAAAVLLLLMVVLPKEITFFDMPEDDENEEELCFLGV